MVQKSKMRAILVMAYFLKDPREHKKRGSESSEVITEKCRLTLKQITKDQYNDVALTFGSGIHTALLPWGLFKMGK